MLGRGKVTWERLQRVTSGEKKNEMSWWEFISWMSPRNTQEEEKKERSAGKGRKGQSPALVKGGEKENHLAPDIMNAGR